MNTFIRQKMTNGHTDRRSLCIKIVQHI